MSGTTIYHVRAPDGSTLHIEGPADASDEQVQQAAAAAFHAPSKEQGLTVEVSDDTPSPYDPKPAAAPPRTLGDYAGMGLRAIGHGIGSLGSLTDALTGQTLASAITGAPTQGQIADASISHLSDIAGLPKPQNDNERLGSAVVSGVTSAIPMLAGGEALAVRPLAQLASGALAGGSGELARQYGAGPAGQTLASLIGGAAAFAPGAIRLPAGAANEATAAGQRLGIRSAPATVGGSAAGVAQMGLGNLPGSGAVIGDAVAQETGDLAGASRKVANTLGTVSTPEAAGASVVQGAKAYRRATAAHGGKLYDARDALVGGPNAPVLLADTRAAITDFASKFPNTPVLGAMMEHPVVRKLAGALPDGAQPEVTLSEATDALSHIRAAERNAARSNSITPSVKARIAKVEQALENDVMRAAQASDAINGRVGNGAEQAQQQADSFWANRSRTLQGPLGRAMDSAADPSKVSSEAVYGQLAKDMGREGGNLTRLKQTWSALPTNSRRTFAATAFDNLGRAKPGAQDAEGAGWSFDTFLTNYSKLSPEARTVVFGGKGVDQQIEDIASYAARLRVIGRTRNFSNTARNTLTGAFMAAIGGQLMHGNVAGAAETVAALPASYAIGKAFLSTPAMRLWTRRALQVVTSDKPSEPALQGLLRQLPVIAANNPEVRTEASHLFRWINDSIGVPASASDRKKDQQEQQTSPQP